jgi:hypothetical protein
MLPLVASVPGPRARALQRQLVLALTARYWVNRLVGRMLFHLHEVDSEPLQARVARVRERIAALRERREPSALSAAGAMAEVTETEEAAPLVRAETVLAELARARAVSE